MMSPKISVIVPVYKAESYLHRCIDSILAQTFQDFEVLLIDDGSPDRSGEICDEYARRDKRVRVFHKENGGVSSSRNCGIENSKGEWVSFIDSDDWIESTFLDMFMQNNSSDLICQGYIYEYNNIAKLNITEIIERNVPLFIKSQRIDEGILLALKEKHIGFCWNKLFKTDIIKQNNIRFKEDVSFREDEIFVVNYCQYISSIIMLPTALYHYIKYGHSSLMNKKHCSLELYKMTILLKEKYDFFSFNSELKSLICRSYYENLAYCIQNISFKDNKIITKEIIESFQKERERQVEKYINHPLLGLWIVYNCIFSLSSVSIIRLFFQLKNSISSFRNNGFN